MNWNLVLGRPLWPARFLHPAIVDCLIYQSVGFWSKNANSTPMAADAN